MNRAIHIKTGNIIDISGIKQGDRILIDIAFDEFKCENTNCPSELVLCSYRSSNFPAPYFRSKTNHIKSCPNEFIGYKYNESEITSRRNGISAFNAVVRKFTKRDKEFAIYNNSTRTINTSSKENNLNRVSRRKIKVGPLIFDGSKKIEEKKTYIINRNDVKINKDSKTGNWLNLSEPNGIGIQLDDEGLKCINDNDELTFFLYPWYINISQKSISSRRYTTKFNFLIVKKNLIIYKKIYKIK